MADLDMDFISRALRMTSFNLSAADFTSLRHKKEIQHLFNMHFFPKFDVSRTISGVNKPQLNSLIGALKHESSEMFKNLHMYNLKGIGPGEVTLYFLVDNCHLGGGSSAGLDVVVGSRGYEVKAVKVSNDRMASDFKLGGTVPLGETMFALNELRVSLKLGGSKTEISGSIMKEMQRRAPEKYAEIEKHYADVAYNNYFHSHEVIFINNSATANMGNIEAVKKVALSDIKMERVTSGTVKPKVKL